MALWGMILPSGCVCLDWTPPCDEEREGGREDRKLLILKDRGKKEGMREGEETLRERERAGNRGKPQNINRKREIGLGKGSETGKETGSTWSCTTSKCILGERKYSKDRV